MIAIKFKNQRTEKFIYPYDKNRKKEEGFEIYDWDGDINDAPFLTIENGLLYIDEPAKQRHIQRLEGIKKISLLKQELLKAKEDVEQVELFGVKRADYELKKEMCKEFIAQLKELEAALK